MKRIYASLFFILSLGAVYSQERNGLSYITEQIDRYCERRYMKGLSPGPRLPYDRIGRAGPQGKPGPPGVVNYTAIEDMVRTVMAENRMEEKIDQALTTINELQNASSAGAETERCQEENKELRAKLDEANSRITDTLERFSKFENDTNKAIASLLNPCSGASQAYAKSWNGTGGVFVMRQPGAQAEVYCDLVTNGGRWTVFQRRMDGSVDFARPWTDYVDGFGVVDKEFWMGLEKLHQLTSSGYFELRIDLTDWDGNTVYAHYRDFFIGDLDSKYQINIGSYSGNAGDSLTYHGGHAFSTFDAGNDKGGGSCSAGRGGSGGWWYNGCHRSNLNGIYKTPAEMQTGDTDGVDWVDWKKVHSYSMKSTEMKFRPIS